MYMHELEKNWLLTSSSELQIDAAERSSTSQIWYMVNLHFISYVGNKVNSHICSHGNDKNCNHNNYIGYWEMKCCVSLVYI